MLSRTLLPLSLSLAWAGVTQAADEAAWPALSSPVGRSEGRSREGALEIAGDSHILVNEGGLACGAHAANEATTATYTPTRLTGAGHAGPGPGLATGPGSHFLWAADGGSDCPSVGPRGCR